MCSSDLAQGVQELVLISQITTNYGLDLAGKPQLAELLRALGEVEIPWIRVHYAYPTGLTEPVLAAYREVPNVVPYLDLPLQHSHPDVLKAMNRDGLFDVFYMQPRLLAATRHVLGPRFKMSSSNFHCPLPGFGHQSIHADWGWTVRTPEVVNAIWMLDDFTVDNGPTRVVPGTHRRGHPFGTALNAPGRTPYDPVPGETVLTGPAGTCVVYNAHLWHGGTQNRTAGLRRSLHSYFTRSCRPTQTRTLEVIDPLVHARLDRARRAILDVPEWVAER